MSTADDDVSRPVVTHVVTHVVTRPSPPGAGAVGLLADATVLATLGAFRVGRRGVRVAGAIVRAVPTPPLATGPRSARALDDLTVRALETRQSVERALSNLLDRLVPVTLAAVLDRVDLTQIVRERVDVDQIVAVVDIDAAATRIDLDAIAKRLDIDAIIGRLDLVALTAEIMSALDIPEIIRESTTSVASGSVTEVRLQSISADEAVARVVDRFRLRRRPRSTSTLPPGPPAPTLPS